MVERNHKTATIGTVKVQVPLWLEPEEQYQRRFVPLTPASRTVTGADDKIAPETDIAQWAIDDWSAGEGDRRWRNRGRYNYSTGSAPASDGSGLVLGMQWTEATTQQSRFFARGDGSLATCRDMDDSLYTWTGTALSSYAAIGGASGDDVVSFAYGEAGDGWYLLDDDEEIRKVTSGGNSSHYAAGSGFDEIIAFEGLIYGTVGLDLYKLDQSSADTKTIIGAAASGAYAGGTRVRRMGKSDVGPIFLSPDNDGTTKIREYNVAQDVVYTKGEIPKDSYAYDIFFHSGIYLVAFRYGENHDAAGDAYLYYQVGNSRGVAGPIRATSSPAQDRICIAGVIGDRIFLVFQQEVWAYDLSTGGISMVADFSSSTLGDGLQAVTYGKDILIAGASGYVWVDTETFEPSTQQDCYMGVYDYGYLGLPKLVHEATVTLDAAKSAAWTVRIGIIVDAETIYWFDDDFPTGDASYTWPISDSAQQFIGTEIEWAVKLASTSSGSSPKVVGFYSEVSGARARIEWVIPIDVAASNEVGTYGDAEDVIEGLNDLRTTKTVVSYSDPFQQRDHQANETFDVRVVDVSTPILQDDGFLLAYVRLQSLLKYGPDHVAPAGC